MATHTARWPAGSPCWVEIMVSDLGRSQEFYRAVLGWEYEDLGESYGHYNNASLGHRRVAGMSPPVDGEDEWPAVWTTYLATDDIEATFEAAVAAGAEVLMEPVDIGDLARVALWADPGGVAFGAWEGRRHTGQVAHAEPGAVGWVDLSTPQLDESKAFYANVFGHTYEDASVDGASYVMFTPRGGDWAVGGMGEQQPDDELGPRWCVTFEVDDVDAALQRVLDAGGSAPDEPWSLGAGRLVTVRGPDGEDFSLLAPTTS